jgi:ATP-dependent Zn protease
MVTQYGMTERIGAVKFGEDNSEPFLGRDIGHTRNYSEEVAATVDARSRHCSRRLTRRRSTSWSTTARSSTPWSSRCSSARLSTRTK